MTKLRTAFGLCVIALTICAFGVQSASAQTAYTCEKVATGETGTFKDEHCKEAGSTLNGYRHSAKAIEGSTPITFTNETTAGARSTMKVKSVQSGITLELQSTEVEGEGVLENKEEGATMWVEASGTLKFKNVTITSPAGKGCIVTGGSITTSKIQATSKGLTNELKLSPSSGEQFVSFTVEGCSVTALNHVYTGTGSVKGNVEGTTITFTHTATTAQHTLSLFGQNVGMEGSLTIKMKGGNGIAVT